MRSSINSNINNSIKQKAKKSIHFRTDTQFNSKFKKIKRKSFPKITHHSSNPSFVAANPNTISNSKKHKKSIYGLNASLSPEHNRKYDSLQNNNINNDTLKPIFEVYNTKTPTHNYKHSHAFLATTENHFHKTTTLELLKTFSPSNENYNKSNFEITQKKFIQRSKKLNHSLSQIQKQLHPKKVTQ